MRIEFLGIPLDAITLDETVEKIDNAIKEGKHISHVVINAGKVVAMQKDKMLFKSVASCDIINADGQSVVWGARFLGAKVPERVAGIDLMYSLLKLAGEKGYTCYFLGAREEVVREVVARVKKKYGSEIVAGSRNGYFTEEEGEEVAGEILQSGANILFVAMASPKKEKFLYQNREILKKVNFTMGVGGSFDVIAGITKRAPVWMQRMGLEWFYRFMQEPKRMWRRYLVGNSRFIWMVIKEKKKYILKNHDKVKNI